MLVLGFRPPRDSSPFWLRGFIHGTGDAVEGDRAHEPSATCSPCRRPQYTALMSAPAQHFLGQSIVHAFLDCIRIESLWRYAPRTGPSRSLPNEVPVSTERSLISLKTGQRHQGDLDRESLRLRMTGEVGLAVYHYGAGAA